MDSDTGVMATNDDAAACKSYAVKAGYWKDSFVQWFIKPPERKAPEISQGYFARVEGIRCLVAKFIEVTGSQCQIVNLGAGFDTLFWHLKDQGLVLKSFLEIDLPGVSSKKCYIIRHRKQLLSVLANGDEEVKFSPSELHSGSYHLLGADLRCLSELKSKLLDQELLNPSLPTLFLCECVLVYLDLDSTSALLKWIAENFSSSVFVNYEQVNMEDKFGEIMVENLKKRGCGLEGVDACKSLETQKQRFLEANWQSAQSWDMATVYNFLPASDRERIEKIEFLDEKELLLQLLQHYCITVAVNKDDTLKEVQFN